MSSLPTDGGVRERGRHREPETRCDRRVTPRPVDQRHSTNRTAGRGSSGGSVSRRQFGIAMETIVAISDARDKQPEASVILQPKLTVRQRSARHAVAAPLERRDTDAIAECQTETRIVESSGERDSLTDRSARRGYRRSRTPAIG
jgi:hypothetical protein